MQCQREQSFLKQQRGILLRITGFAARPRENTTATNTKQNEENKGKKAGNDAGNGAQDTND